MATLKQLAPVTVLLLALAAGAGLPLAAAEIKNDACLECHGDNTLYKTNAAGKGISMFVDLAKLTASVHKTNACVSCHSDITAKHPDDNVAAKAPDCARCHAEQTETYGASVHGVAAANGQKDAATCTDCHDGHTILPPTSPASPLHWSHLAETCGACHEQAAKDVEMSVHGQAVAAGHRDAPTCTDCHSEHKIVGLKNRSSFEISADICSNCHASERLNTKYNLPPDRVKTFFESYHGLAAQYGSTLAANCASCHGVHKILPSSDPRSTIYATNLVATCGKCHPGATENFASSKVHVDAATASDKDSIGQKINWWVRRIYLVLIVGTIGFMLAHNLLVFSKKVAARYRAAHLTVLRMNYAQRLQHFVLAASFIILAVSGFALKFPESWIGKAMGSNEMFRRWTHRVAGVILLAVGAYHLVYILAKKEGRQLVKDLFPTLKDAQDLLGSACYLTGLSSDKPKIGRFGYAEKMEYWAVIWGTIIMGATGLMVWFKMDVTRFLPRWAVDVALTIHYYEAILACLAIVVWHFYHVIFDPDVYPLNWACWKGKVSKHWQEEEHPLGSTARALTPRKRRWKPPQQSWMGLGPVLGEIREGIESRHLHEVVDPRQRQFELEGGEEDSGAGGLFESPAVCPTKGDSLYTLNTPRATQFEQAPFTVTLGPRVYYAGHMNGINVRPGRLRVLRAVLVVVSVLVANGLVAKDTLQIDRGFIGTTDAWRDVTAFLRQHLSGGALSVTIAQPFTGIGGDPASGKVKNLIVDYRLNGQAFRLWLVEKYPVAFTVQLPSPDAKAQGADSKVQAMLKNIFSTLHVVAEGDPLPDLAPLGLGRDVAPTNKPILLCLFDSQQRPSRHLVRQVAGQYEALRQKGFTVLGVQAAVSDSRSFQEWKGSNAFPFPVGQVVEESEQTAWVTGIESLPWLMLTDAHRRIVAEGFALEEIEAKLKAVEK